MAATNDATKAAVAQAIVVIPIATDKPCLLSLVMPRERNTLTASTIILRTAATMLTPAATQMKFSGDQV
jgi:hypothetical protein